MIMSALSMATTVSTYVIVGVVLGVALLRLWTWLRLARSHEVVLGFYHPYCNSGGGGERVLWKAVQQVLVAEQQRKGEKGGGTKPVQVLIYTGDNDATPDAILAKANRRFHVGVFQGRVEFQYVKTRVLLEAWMYPRFTMIGQSLGSMVLALECLLRRPCHVFVDTTGFAFSYPVAKVLFGCRVACYTHYPTISSDMLKRVIQNRPSYNNDTSVASSTTLSSFKVVYYKLFARAYALVGWFADVLMANSNWTRAHIEDIWGRRPGVVFPPCDCSSLERVPLVCREYKDASEGVAGRRPVVLSLGQFRPEKDHILQLESFRRFKASLTAKDNAAAHDSRLVMIGGCRNKGDEGRVAHLRKKIKEYGLTDVVDIQTNVPYATLLEYLRTSAIGIHTMWNEHFGIGVVEFMAAGVTTVAHRSGGPQTDIVVREGGTETGFLAETPDEYSGAMRRIFDMDPEASLRMKKAARRRVHEFSDEKFMEAFGEAIRPLCS